MIAPGAPRLPVRAVVFDLDGTLTDSLAFSVSSIAEACREVTGRPVSELEVLSRLGPSESGVIRALVGVEAHDAADRRFGEIYRAEHRRRVSVFEGIPQLLLGLRNRGLPTAVVTGKGEATARWTLEATGLAAAVGRVWSGSIDGGFKRENLGRAIAQFGLAPRDVAYVGDQPSDMAIAREAGVRPVGAGWAPGADRASMALQGAEVVLRSPRELLRWVDGQARPRGPSPPTPTSPGVGGPGPRRSRLIRGAPMAKDGAMARTKARIAAVFFDLGGTLVDDRDFARWSDAAARLNLDAPVEGISRAFAEVEEIADRDPQMGVHDFWRETLSRAAGVPLPQRVAERFCATLREGPCAYPLFSDVRRCLDLLARQRRRLGIISNSESSDRVREILRNADLEGRFDPIVSSGTEGVRKPHPEIFHRALELAGIPARSAFYVGNLPETDARAASRAGLNSIWLNRNGTGFGEDPPEITSLLELPLAIRRLETSGPP